MARGGPGPGQGVPQPQATLTLVLRPNVRLSWPGQLATNRVSILQTCIEAWRLSAAHVPALAPDSGPGLGLLMNDPLPLPDE